MSTSDEIPIMDLVCNRIRDVLEEKLMTDIDSDDLSRVSVVKVGRYQSDPSGKNTVSVLIGDPDDQNFYDGIVSLEKMESIAFHVPPREIGGGEMWWRRGRVSVNIFRLGKKEDLTMTYAGKIVGRTLKAFKTIKVSDLRDSYGEHAILAIAYANTMVESGGPSNQYIWRVTIRFAVLTERT